jgi:hypothetical protein
VACEVLVVIGDGGKVIAKVVPDAAGSSILRLIQKRAVPGSVIYTDEYPVYDAVPRMRTSDGEPANFRHGTIRGADGVYVRGDILTNSVEGFWMLVRTGIRGVRSTFRV